MNNYNPKLFSKLQVEAFKECFDLVSNGYVEVFSCYRKSFWFVKLKHNSNGRCLTVIWDNKGWRIKENGKVLKEVFA